jgi:hypothetical protein
MLSMRTRGSQRLFVQVALAATAVIAATAAQQAVALDSLRATDRPKVTAVKTPGGMILGLQCISSAWLQWPVGIPVSPLLSYSWVANGLPVGGATTPFYAVRASDTGKGLVCVVNAIFTRGSASRVTTYRGVSASAPFIVKQPGVPTISRKVGPAVLVMLRSRTRTVDAGGRLPIALSVTCASGCNVVVTARIRVGRKTFRAEFQRRFAAASRKLLLVMSPPARAALRRTKRGQANVLITVRGQGGSKGKLTQILTLRAA